MTSWIKRWRLRDSLNKLDLKTKEIIVGKSLSHPFPCFPPFLPVCDVRGLDLLHRWSQCPTAMVGIWLRSYIESMFLLIMGMLTDYWTVQSWDPVGRS